MNQDESSGAVRRVALLGNQITSATCEDYRNARLRELEVSTVRKEFTTLRQFVKWASVRGELSEPVTVASVSKKALGTPSKKRVRVDLSAEQAEIIIAALPETSRFGHPIRALFTVVWDTGLRISALRRLESPRHFAPGEDCLRISRDIDKNRWERPLALTPRSRRHLEEWCPAKGVLIFGQYN
jgi:integrase